MFIQKYPFFDKAMLIESLVASELADESLDPIILKEMTWSNAKSIIRTSVKEYYESQVAKRKKAQEDRVADIEKLLKNKRKKE